MQAAKPAGSFLEIGEMGPSLKSCRDWGFELYRSLEDDSNSIDRKETILTLIDKGEGLKSFH